VCSAHWTGVSHNSEEDLVGGKRQQDGGLLLLGQQQLEAQPVGLLGEFDFVHARVIRLSVVGPRKVARAESAPAALRCHAHA
jgi:hypothetical protein